MFNIVGRTDFGRGFPLQLLRFDLLLAAAFLE